MESKCRPRVFGSSGKKANAFHLMQEKFIKSVSARLTVAQVVQNVQSGAELTFDFSVYVVMAAWLAAIGLIENSLVCLVASMLVSPMMVSVKIIHYFSKV
jgi:hypothetical protein